MTGAGRGLGLAYARELAARGARVVVHDLGVDAEGRGEDPSVAAGAVAAIRAGGWTAHAASGSINTRDGCVRLIEDAITTYGRLDVLIHNAGWVGYQTVETLTPEFLARALTIQVEAPVWLAQAAWPAMTGQNYGRVVLTTSDVAIYPQYSQKGLIAYAVAKMGQLGLMNILADEGAERGIVVNAVSPVAKTRMWGVEGEPDELHPNAVAPGVVYLASSECQQSAWILRASNGQFHGVQWRDAEGVNYPQNLASVEASTPEMVAAKWNQIAVNRAEPRC